MPNGNIGFSAMDALQPGQGGASGGAPAGVRGASPQQAVKILSLRVPERVSQGAIAPLPLLQSKGSAAPGAQGLDSMVAALMNLFKSQAPMGGAPNVPGAPAAPMADGSGNGGGGNDIWRVPSHDPDQPRSPIIPVDGGSAPEHPRTPTFSAPPAPRITPGDEDRGRIPVPGAPAPQSPMPTFGAMPVPSDDGPSGDSPIFDNGPIDFPADEPAPAPSLFDNDAPDQPWWMQKNESLFV